MLGTTASFNKMLMSETKLSANYATNFLKKRLVIVILPLKSVTLKIKVTI
jgi:hypothetical protein